MKNIQIPQERLADFCQQHQIRWLALFGSVLRDDFGPDAKKIINRQDPKDTKKKFIRENLAILAPSR